MKKRLVAVLGTLALISACASSPEGKDEMSGKMSVSEQFVKDVQNRVYFGFNKSELTPESIDVLKKQALWFCEHSDQKIVLQGYTDPRGTQTYNLGLGERRAMAVRDFLVAEGIEADRITVISYGKEHLASTMNNPAGWAKDRRVVTISAAK